MKDHKVRIEVGYGLESSLTDADCVPDHPGRHHAADASGNVDGAVSSGVAAMLTTITPSYKASRRRPRRTKPGASPMSPAWCSLIRDRPRAGLWISVLTVIVLQVIGSVPLRIPGVREGPAGQIAT